MLVYQRRNEFNAKSVSHYLMSTTKECDDDIARLSEEEEKKFWHFYNLLENNKGLPTEMRPRRGYPLVGDLEGYQHAVFFKEETNKANGVKICEVVYRIDGDTATIVAVGAHFGGEDVLRLAKKRVGAKRVDNKRVRKQKQKGQENKVEGSQLFDFFQKKGLGRTSNNSVGFDIDSFSFGGSEALDDFITKG